MRVRSQDFLGKILGLLYGLEMANRFMVDKGNVDLSPISAKSIRSVFVSSSLLYYLPGFRSTVLYGGLRPFAY